MTENLKHADNEKAWPAERPDAVQPPAGPSNPDNRSNSGYPAGGEQAEGGKDAYGRDPAERRLAGLPPTEASDAQPPAVPNPHQ
jgi:hypothetical protein